MSWWDRWFGWARRAPTDAGEDTEPTEEVSPSARLAALSRPAAASPSAPPAPATVRAAPAAPATAPAPAAKAPAQAAKPPKKEKPPRKAKAKHKPAKPTPKPAPTAARPKPPAASEVLSAEEAERRYGALLRQAEAAPPAPVADEPVATPTVDARPTAEDEAREAAAEARRVEEAKRRAAAAESRQAAMVPRYEALLFRADALLAVPEAELRHLRIGRDELSQGWRRLGPAPEAVASALDARRDATLARFDARIGVFEAAERAITDQHKAAREAVIAEARALAERADLRGAGPAMGELRAKLRACGPVREEDHAALSAAFAEAEQRLRARQEELRAGRDQARAEQLGKLEALVRAAESLGTARDPVAAADRVKQLQADWKTVRVPGDRAESDALWARFRAACDAVFARRAAAWEDAAQAAIDRLEAIVADAERLAEEGCDPDEVIPRLMTAWKRAGRAPREAQDPRWERLQAAFGRMRAPHDGLDLGDAAPVAWRPFEALLKDKSP